MLEAENEENRRLAEQEEEKSLDKKLKKLVKKATTITPQNLTFYMNIFDHKKQNGKRIV